QQLVRGGGGEPPVREAGAAHEHRAQAPHLGVDAVGRRRGRHVGGGGHGGPPRSRVAQTEIAPVASATPPAIAPATDTTKITSSPRLKTRRPCSRRVMTKRMVAGA